MIKTLAATMFTFLWFAPPAWGFVLKSVRTGAASIRRVSIADDDASLKAASDFMIDHFWLPLTPSSLTPTERSSLLETQLTDFEGRYGRLLGKRKLNSALLVQQGSGALEVCLSQKTQ